MLAGGGMDAKCECGRKWSECVYVVQRSGQNRWIHYRCICSREWTVHEMDADPADPVTSDEIIELHRILKGDLTMEDIRKGKSV